MPIMFGFASQRKKMLEAELDRYVEEMPQLGMTRMWIIGDLAKGSVEIDSTLELALVQETDEPWRRRADFWNVHLRPRVGTEFHVFTTDEFERFAEDDPILRQINFEGEQVYG